VIRRWLVTGRICDCRQEKTASPDAVYSGLSRARKRASRSVPFYGATTVSITGSEPEALPLSAVRCDAVLRYTTIEEASLFPSTHLVLDACFDPMPKLQFLVALTVTDTLALSDVDCI
jgi:hypothetical protein